MDATLRLLRSAPPTALFGLFIILAYSFIAIFAPVLTPYGETEIVGAEFEPWGEGFLLGTDSLGRDMLTRLIFGARNTIGIAFLTTALAFVLGSVTGFLAATISGWVDQLLSRIVDVLMAIPALIFSLLVLTIVGTSITNMVLVIAVLESTRVFRLARAVAESLAVKIRPHTLAAPPPRVRKQSL